MLWIGLFGTSGCFMSKSSYIFSHFLITTESEEFPVPIVFSNSF